MCDIGGIQASTQANFYYCMLHVLVMKVIQCESRSYFISYEWAKLSPLLYLFGSSTHYRYQCCNFVFANEMSLDTHALAKRMQIRLCIEAGTYPGFT